jgi:hypothetical protein
LIVVILVLAAGAVVLVLNPGIINSFRTTQTITDETLITETVSVFVRNPYKDDYSVTRIPGYADNLGTRDIASVSLEITLYEKEERREIVEYRVVDVPAGSRKSFDANAGTIGGARTAQVRVVAIEVYE